jgi:hypothetical protein
MALVTLHAAMHRATAISAEFEEQRSPRTNKRKHRLTHSNIAFSYPEEFRP